MNDLQPKVSVIVPVYNVEPCLRRCIDSIIGQTMKRVEIILVNDGSTDRSGKICDEYAAGDERIRVIHKATNEGLSCARNDGIESSTAQYLMFVDGDDWVSPKFCENAYNAIKEYSADLVIFRACSVKNGRIKKPIHKSRLTGIVDAETAMVYGGNAAWNKIYRRDLFSSIRYPVGMVYEDVAVTHRIVFSAKRIAMISDELYFWVIRKDSITHQISREKCEDSLVAALQKAEDLRRYGCESKHILPVIASFSVGYMARVNPSNDSLYKKAEEVLDGIKWKNVLLIEMSWKKKALLLLWKTNKGLFHLVCKLGGIRIQ